MQPWFLEALEDRLLLAGSPTIDTVNSTETDDRHGRLGTPPYVIGRANANTNKAGSEVQFDPSVFKTAADDHTGQHAGAHEDCGPGSYHRSRCEHRDGQWQ